ncbi:MAG TPA: hypothetical protein VFL85_03455 [Candidatus Saccharimonadales bacterium]|nr:hypothetical protein [Candidatus Saccharimonadales bacterium]
MRQVSLLAGIQSQHNHDLNTSFVAQHAYDTTLPMNRRTYLEHMRQLGKLAHESVIFHTPIATSFYEMERTVYGVCFLVREGAVLHPSYAPVVEVCHGDVMPVGSLSLRDAGMVLGLAREIESHQEHGEFADLSLNFLKIHTPQTIWQRVQVV